MIGDAKAEVDALKTLDWQAAQRASASFCFHKGHLWRWRPVGHAILAARSDPHAASRRTVSSPSPLGRTSGSRALRCASRAQGHETHETRSFFIFWTLRRNRWPKVWKGKSNAPGGWISVAVAHVILRSCQSALGFSRSRRTRREVHHWCLSVSGPRKPLSEVYFLRNVPRGPPTGPAEMPRACFGKRGKEGPQEFLASPKERSSGDHTFSRLGGLNLGGHWPKVGSGFVSEAGQGHQDRRVLGPGEHLPRILGARRRWLLGLITRFGFGTCVPLCIWEADARLA